jgi:hypothetical protein
MKVTHDRTGLSFLHGGLLMLAFALGRWTFQRRQEAVAS